MKVSAFQKESWYLFIYFQEVVIMVNVKKLIRNLTVSGLCVALGIVLPIAFHSIPNAGSVMLPMHLPVLLCGLICGPYFGLLCGLLTPFLSCVITSMPSWGYLPSMLCELAVYGLAAGLLAKIVVTKYRTLNIYISLLGSMICGRIVYGIINALIFRSGNYSMQIWITSMFVTALPGIIIQLVIIPIIILALQQSKLISVS